MFSPKDFVDLAEKLISERRFPDSAKTRTILNRAYYGAFLITKTRLEELGESFTSDEEIHKEVIHKLKEKDDNLADKLNNLYDDRMVSDYNLKEEPGADVRTNVGIAKFLVNKMPRFTP